ncbi:MAG TPA: methyltransferase domain-containing protein [Kiritimatiellia bacterium]|nr:methyltransferase domain-containing protein [Kiritimatiellia bacterium]HPS07809.1 methyltransferase domain-containing protein [Kiritimatiellia bacterium]
MEYQATQDRVGYVRRLRLFLNGLGSSRTCCVCGKTFFRFSKYRGGWKAFSAYLHNLKWTGSDFDQFWCPFCRSHDRERHLILFFDKLGFWEKFANAAVLHFAPEKQLASRIGACRPARYVKGDLVPSREGVEKIDVTDIPYAAASFDWVLCNHVLEHVPDDAKALRELFRVLKPGGIAILQTPFASGLEKTLEDPEEINTDEKRTAFYGQEDHVRLYGRDLFDRIRAAGFQLELRKHGDCLPDIDASRYGVNREEPLFLCVKPKSLV